MALRLLEMEPKLQDKCQWQWPDGPVMNVEPWDPTAWDTWDGAPHRVPAPRGSASPSPSACRSPAPAPFSQIYIFWSTPSLMACESALTHTRTCTHANRTTHTGIHTWAHSHMHTHTLVDCSKAVCDTLPGSAGFYQQNSGKNLPQIFCHFSMTFLMILPLLFSW